MAIDIAIYESADGGEVNLVNEDIELIAGLTNQVYLALFGGNVEQDTSDELNDLDQRFDWWGNAYLPTNQQFNSTFERTISKVAITGEGLSILEDAAKKDLEYLQEYADIQVQASVTQPKRVELIVSLTEPDSESTKIKFIWDSTRNTVIQETII
jgi:phage gp46-like protein